MQKLVIGNWKMHGDAAFMRDWRAAFRPPRAGAGVIAVCPPLPYLPLLRPLLPDGVWLGAQNVAAAAADGAHTGEVSARMLADVGCHLTLIGHSERRAGGETNAHCAGKIAAAAAAGLTAVLCVGEDAAARAQGDAAAVVLAQLAAATAAADDVVWQNLAVAYEPVWAIGSGKTPAADEISTMHAALRRRLIAQSPAFGGKIPLLYGGSVTPESAEAFAAAAYVDGFLVGGASLDAARFAAICATTFSP